MSENYIKDAPLSRLLTLLRPAAVPYIFPVAFFVLVLFFNVPPIIYFCIIMLLTAVYVRRDRGMLLVLGLAIFPLRETLLRAPCFFHKIMMTDLLLAMYGIALLVSRFIKGSAAVYRTAAELPLSFIAFLCTVIFAGACALPDFSVLAELPVFVYLICFIPLIINDFLRSNHTPLELEKIILFTAALQLIVIAAAWTFIRDDSRIFLHARLTGTFKNPNVLGFFLGVAALIILYRFPRYIYSCLPFVAGVAATRSQAAVYSLAVLLVGYVISRKCTWIKILVCLAALGILLTAVDWQRFHTGSRITLITENLRNIRGANLVCGTGPGSMYALDNYTKTLMETGVLGLSIFLWVCITVTRTGMSADTEKKLWLNIFIYILCIGLGHYTLRWSILWISAAIIMYDGNNPVRQRGINTAVTD